MNIISASLSSRFALFFRSGLVFGVTVICGLNPRNRFRECAGEAVEEYRELATTVSIAKPASSDKKEVYAALMDRTHKQRTLIVTMMAEAYQNAHRESFPTKTN